MNGTSVRLVLPSEVRLIDLIHSATEKMAGLAGLDADDALNVGLAVREAAINAIIHGNGQDPKLEVNVTMTANADGFEVTITDEGEGFDPDTTPDPTEAVNLLQTSGRGLLMIRAFVDDVVFRRRKKRGMAVTITKRKNQAAG